MQGYDGFGNRYRMARRWLSAQVIVVLLAIVAASMQCAARCATTSCHSVASSPHSGKNSHLPPCHRHSQSKQDATTEPCNYLFLVNSRTSPVFQVEHLSDHFVVDSLAVSAIVFFQLAEQIAVSSASPPKPQQLSSFFVLRI